MLAVIALSSGYALKMAAEYAMGPSPDAAAKLKVFQQEKDFYGIEYRLASGTFDDEGDATYVFEAVGREGARVVIEPRFYPVLEIEFVPAGFIRVSSPPIRVSTPFSAIWRRYSDERGAAVKISRTDDKLWLPSLSEYVPAELLSPSCSLSPSLAGEGSQYGLYRLMLHLNDQDERASEIGPCLFYDHDGFIGVEIFKELAPDYVWLRSVCIEGADGGDSGDSFFAINPETGQITDAAAASTWGYIWPAWCF